MGRVVRKGEGRGGRREKGGEGREKVPQTSSVINVMLVCSCVSMFTCSINLYCYYKLFFASLILLFSPSFLPSFLCIIVVCLFLFCFCFHFYVHVL